MGPSEILMPWVNHFLHVTDTESVAQVTSECKWYLLEMFLLFFTRESDYYINNFPVNPKVIDSLNMISWFT